MNLLLGQKRNNRYNVLNRNRIYSKFIICQMIDLNKLIKNKIKKILWDNFQVILSGFIFYIYNYIFINLISRYMFLINNYIFKNILEIIRSINYNKDINKKDY